MIIKMINGYVYLICDPANNTYKIGVTRNLNSNRIKKLQTGNSTELHIVTTYATQWPFRMEKMLHIKYRSEQALNEWFNLSVDDVIHFNKVCEDMNETIISMLENPFFAKGLK